MNDTLAALLFLRFVEERRDRREYQGNFGVQEAMSRWRWILGRSRKTKRN